MSVDSVLNYAINNFSKFEQDLCSCLRIPSISTIPDHQNDINMCADFVAEHLADIGLKNVRQFKDYGNPIVFADNGYDVSKPTVLLWPL